MARPRKTEVKVPAELVTGAQAPMSVDQLVAMLSETKTAQFEVDESRVASALESAESVAGMIVPHKAILDTIDTCKSVADYAVAAVSLDVKSIGFAEIIGSLNDYNRVILNTGEEAARTTDALAGLCAVPAELEDGFI